MLPAKKIRRIKGKAEREGPQLPFFEWDNAYRKHTHKQSTHNIHTHRGVTSLGVISWRSARSICRLEAALVSSS